MSLDIAKGPLAVGGGRGEGKISPGREALRMEKQQVGNKDDNGRLLISRAPTVCPGPVLSALHS